MIPIGIPLASLPPAIRLALIIENVGKAIGSRTGGLNPSLRLCGLLASFIWRRLCRISARFTRAIETRPSPYRARPQRPAKPRPIPQFILPRHFAWLLRMVQETSIGTAQLRDFLTDPNVIPLLQADPRLCRILRPLCHMLGLRPSRYLPPRIKRPRKPRPPAEQPPDAAPAAKQPAAKQAVAVAAPPESPPQPPSSPRTLPPPAAFLKSV